MGTECGSSDMRNIAVLGQGGSDIRQEVRGDGVVHQQGLGGVAGAVALGLGIQCHREGLVRVGLVVHVDMADAVQVLDHRHPGILADALDQAFATAWDDDINRIFQTQ